MKIGFFLVFVLSFFWVLEATSAAEFDEELVGSLKIEANHDLQRLKSFKVEAENNKIFNAEREKALGEFLEEQEKWDLLRERGLQDYLRQNRMAPLSENSVEYNKYLEEKEAEGARYEHSRKIHIVTRDKVRIKTDDNMLALESDELGLNSDRPRYLLRKRSRNKWVGSANKVGKSNNSGYSSGNNSGGAASPPLVTPTTDFPTNADFPAAPVPYDGFDDVAPPPTYDSNNGGVPYDPSFGGELSIPPPPPPPPDFGY